MGTILFMTASEVAGMAFGGEGNVRMEFVTDTVIASAQHRFLKPVLNGLYDAIGKGRYPELLDGFVKGALAQWVKLLVLPSLSAQTGVMGVVQYGGQGFSGADDRALSRLLRRTRADAATLTDALIEHIESAPSDYPEYSAAENVRHSVSMAGGVVL